MVSHKIFKRVLAEYFRYILTIEGGCGNECCFDIPGNTIWFNLLYLDDYFDKSYIPSITYKYFTKIDPVIKREILERFPHLKPYFKENLWFQIKDPTTSTLTSDSITSVLTSDPITSILTSDPITSNLTSNSSKSMASRYKSGNTFNTECFEPSTSGYRSPGTQSLQNSPVGSRSNSPIPTNIQENNQINQRKNLSAQRSNSVNSTESEESVIEQRRRYNFRKKPRKKTCNLKKTTKPKRKYNKRLKLYTYMNELPENLHHLKPHESNLILQSIDGRQINDLNVPLPICKTIFKQCRTVNPVTKRYTSYEDDGSENIPFNIHLRY